MTDGVKKDVLLRRANIKKMFFTAPWNERHFQGVLRQAKDLDLQTGGLGRANRRV